VEKVLHGLGVRSIGELARLSPSLLKHLFGVAGLALHQYANAIDNSPVEPPAEAKSISRSTTLPQDTLDRPFLEAMLAYLSERVGAELRRQGKQAGCVILRLRYADFETLQRQKMLTEVTDCDEVIFSEGKKLMEALLSQRNKLVRLIAIGVSRLEKERQLSLWDGGKRERELNRTKDSLRHKYGFNVLEWGRTFYLRDFFPIERGYVLQTPALSR
jgi:DNA polymerase-4